MKCPKCGKSAYYGGVVERKARITDPPFFKVYTYREYLHYAGSKKSISLKALEDVLNRINAPEASSFSMALYRKEIMKLARERAGSKVIHHYGPV